MTTTRTVLATAEPNFERRIRRRFTSGATTARDIEISAAAIVAAWRAERLTQPREATATGRGLTSNSQELAAP